MANGILVAVTGIDGAGKTTLISDARERLIDDGVRVETLRTHEPDAPQWDTYKRIARVADIPYEYDRLLQAMELCTRCHADLPGLLAQNDLVFTDRYIIDKKIYGRLRGIQRLAEIALTTIPWQPDLTLFIDVTVETAHQRIQSKGGPVDWKERPEMLHLARDAYRALFHSGTEPLLRIDGEQAREAVLEDALAYLRPALRAGGIQP